MKIKGIIKKIMQAREVNKEVGKEINKNRTSAEYENTAYHEAGHAVVLHFIDPNEDINKVSIKPREHCLGFVSRTSYTHDAVREVAFALAGDISLSFKFNTKEYSVSPDLKYALDTAPSMDVLDEGRTKAYDVLKKNWACVKAVAEKLMDVKEINGKMFKKIIASV